VCNGMLLPPEMGEIAAARGDSRQKLGDAAGDGGDVPKKLHRIRLRSALRGGVQ